MRETTLNEKEVRTVLAVFEDLVKMPYCELNKMIGSITIKEMQDLNSKLRKWYLYE